MIYLCIFAIVWTSELFIKIVRIVHIRQNRPVCQENSCQNPLCSQSLVILVRMVLLEEQTEVSLKPGSKSSILSASNAIILGQNQHTCKMKIKNALFVSQSVCYYRANQKKTQEFSYPTNMVITPLILKQSGSNFTVK